MSGQKTPRHEIDNLTTNCISSLLFIQNMFSNHELADLFQKQNKNVHCHWKYLLRQFKKKLCHRLSSDGKCDSNFEHAEYTIMNCTELPMRQFFAIFKQFWSVHDYSNVSLLLLVDSGLWTNKCINIVTIFTNHLWSSILTITGQISVSIKN